MSEKLAPLQRGQGECWPLIGDGKAPADNRREAEMGTGKRWECWWLMTNLKGKLIKETSPTKHLPYLHGYFGQYFLHYIGYAGIISIL